MRFTLKWSTPSKNNFSKILMFIMNKWGLKAANEFIIDVEGMVKVISNMPEAFPAFKERKNVRRCVINKRTVLFYQVKGDTVFLVNFYDTRLNPERFNV